MMNKLQRALRVVEDLKTLSFQVDHYTATHPDNKYSIWIANGFLFIALYTINGKYVDDDHSVSKFGAIGKVLVWWEVRKVVSRYKKKRKQEKADQATKMFTNLLSK